MIVMKYMGWDYRQLSACKMSRYHAIVRLLNSEARQAGRRR